MWRQVDCVISGLYPFDVESIAVLGYVTEEEEEEEDEEEDGDRRRQLPTDQEVSLGRHATRQSAYQVHHLELRRRADVCDLVVFCGCQARVRHRAELQLWDRTGGTAPFSAEILPLFGEERVRRRVMTNA